MPIIKSAIKRMKQTAKRRDRNVGIKKDIKLAVKEFFANPSQKTLSAAQSEIDTATKKKLIKKNTASRRKARLSRIAKEAGVTLASAPEKKPVTKKKAAPKAAEKKTEDKKATAKKKAAPKTATKKPAAKKTTAKKEA